MSNVAKSDHGESRMEFLRQAREMKLMTIRKCNKIPHKDGKMKWTDMYQSLQSWRSYAEYGNAHRTIRQMEAYYNELVFHDFYINTVTA